MSFSELVPELLVDLLACLGGINSEAIAAIAEGSHYWQRLVLESSDSLGYSVRLIVRTSAGLASFGHAGCHGFRGTVEVDQVSNHHLIRQSLLKLLPILFISREAIKKISSIATLGNTRLEQIYNERGW